MHIMNLNKQSRLYQQGMTPMMKIVPGRAGWERMRDRPEWEVCVFFSMINVKCHCVSLLLYLSASVTKSLYITLVLLLLIYEFVSQCISDGPLIF